MLSIEDINAIKLSTVFATSAASIAMVPAILLGYWLARSSAKYKWAVEAFANLPLVLPPVVTGYLLLILLAPGGPIGKILNAFDLKIVFTPYAAIIAAMVVSFPLALRTCKLAFSSIDHNLETTARTLGASKIETFREISIPMAKHGIVAAWLLAFARSLGEFGATIMIAGNIAGKTQTIPLAIFSKATQPGGIELSYPLVILSIIISSAAIIVGEAYAKNNQLKINR